LIMRSAALMPQIPVLAGSLRKCAATIRSIGFYALSA